MSNQPQPFIHIFFTVFTPSKHSLLGQRWPDAVISVGQMQEPTLAQCRFAPMCSVGPTLANSIGPTTVAALAQRWQINATALAQRGQIMLLHCPAWANCIGCTAVTALVHRWQINATALAQRGQINATALVKYWQTALQELTESLSAHYK